jgi:hypothetical protein
MFLAQSWPPRFFHANGGTPQPYVTELDLRHSLIPDELIEDLLQTMPPHHGPEATEDRGLARFDYVRFMEKMTDGSSAGHAAVDAPPMAKACSAAIRR